MIQQIFVYEYDAEGCGNKHESSPVKLYGGDMPYRAEIPAGWKFIDGRLYCHMHRVEIRVISASYETAPP